MDFPHLSLEQIGDLALGLAPSPTQEAHLASCPACGFEVSRLGQLTRTMQADTTQDAPTYIIAAILRDFDKFQTQPAPRPSLPQRILARLQMDSARLTPSFGFRAGQAANSRQLLFMTFDGILDLRITPRQAQWVVSGQLLGQILRGKAVLLGPGGPQESELSADSSFTLPPVSSGVYQLRLLADDMEIEVPDLNIGG